MPLTSEVELLTHDQRERLGALADALIPGGLGLPSATGANAHAKWMDRVFSARPDLAECVRDVIGRPGDPAALLADLQRNDTETFGAFTFAVAGAYLMNPKVCHLLGLPGNAPKPKPPLSDEAEYYFRDDLLDPVKARGPIYRPTP